MMPRASREPNGTYEHRQKNNKRLPPHLNRESTDSGKPKPPYRTRVRMQVKDLRRFPPRRWCEELGGIRWLPRLIDKTRAALDGRLGDYLFGQSPMDAAFLRQFGIGHRRFAEIVRNATDDDAVFAALEACGPERIARARAWSDALPWRLPFFFFLLDVDDGYAPSVYYAWKRPANVVSGMLSQILKRLFPTRALDPPAK